MSRGVHDDDNDDDDDDDDIVYAPFVQQSPLEAMLGLLPSSTKSERWGITLSLYPSSPRWI